jgi:hypothetical protein
MKFEDTVLARRFTIICLIFMVFGMSFATLVTSRSAHANKFDVSSHCMLKANQSCQVSR